MKRIVLLALMGCEPTSHVGSQGPDGPLADCTGPNDAFAFSGAIPTFQAYDFGLVTSGGNVVGMAGSALNTDVLAFNTLPLTELSTLGDHDIATQNITSLRAPFNHSCDTGNTVCHGFFAHGGTYSVTAVHPRYQATFTLTDLFERTDNTANLGAPIAGTITGCVDKANP